MKKIYLLLISVVLVISCQVPDGGGEIIVSGKNFIIASAGESISITTSGATNCTLTEPNKEDSIKLHLNNSLPVSYEGSWYSFESKYDGKELLLTFEKNSTQYERVLYLTLTNADLYTRINIVQSCE